MRVGGAVFPSKLKHPESNWIYQSDQLFASMPIIIVFEKNSSLLMQ